MEYHQRALNNQSLVEAVERLAERDHDIAVIVSAYGYPPLWARQPGFPTLVYIILEQQVSLASARAAFDRLLGAANMLATDEQPNDEGQHGHGESPGAMESLSPDRFLSFSDEELRAIGFSRQKTGYCRGLARALLDGSLDLDRLHQLEDDQARSALISLKGIGPWTADIYLLMAMLRPDIWPAGDLALGSAIQSYRGLPSRPNLTELQAMAERWKPWRSVAARVFWHYYLSQ
jgi:DNA-3-methyladenine glycosylase II